MLSGQGRTRGHTPITCQDHEENFYVNFKESLNCVENREEKGFLTGQLATSTKNWVQFNKSGVKGARVKTVVYELLALAGD